MIPNGSLSLIPPGAKKVVVISGCREFSGIVTESSSFLFSPNTVGRRLAVDSIKSKLEISKDFSPSGINTVLRDSVKSNPNFLYFY